jgi:hypothetical protein
VPLLHASEVLQALSAAYPEAPPPARRAWVGLVNRCPPGLLALVPLKIRELQRRNLLRCPRVVLYRWLVDQLTQLDVQLPAFAKRHSRPQSQHWRGGLTVNDMPQVAPAPPSPETAAQVDQALARIQELVDQATPRISRSPVAAGEDPEPIGCSRAKWLAWRNRQDAKRRRSRLGLVERSDTELRDAAAAYDMQTQELVARYLARRRSLSTERGHHVNPQDTPPHAQAEGGATPGAGPAGQAGGAGA